MKRWKCQSNLRKCGYSTISLQLSFWRLTILQLIFNSCLSAIYKNAKKKFQWPLWMSVSVNKCSFNIFARLCESFFWTLVIKCKSLTSFFVRCYHAWRLRQIVGNFMETVSTIMFVHINSHCGKDLTFLKLPLLPFWTLVSFSAGVGIQKGKWAHKELKPGEWTLTVMRGKNKS